MIRKIFYFQRETGFLSGESSRRIDSVEDHVCVHESSPGHCTHSLHGSRFPTFASFSFFSYFFFLFFVTEPPLPLSSPPFVPFNPRPPPFSASLHRPSSSLRRPEDRIAIFYRFYSREHLAYGQRGPQEISGRVVRPFFGQTARLYLSIAV